MATPLTVVTWLDPYEQTDFGLDSAVTWHVAFADRITKEPVDPDTVGMSYNEPLTAASTSVTATKDATGFYHADLELGVVGRWVLTVQPEIGGANVGMGSMTLQVFDAAA